MGKWAQIDFSLCDPSECGHTDGACRAAQACPRRLLLQEPDESPMLLSSKLCSGCAKCVPECPRGAIEMANGV